MVQAGFELVAKREMTGGFGVVNCEANRHLLGNGWKAQACEPDDWEITPAEVVFGNPPCSGFSVMSAKTFRGADSKINHCMWAFVRYVARVMPQIAVFESVQQAYSEKNGGRDLMRALRVELESLTDKRWDLYHVNHNAYSVGGAAQRKRYFWIASRIPFGITMPKLPKLPNLYDVIGDLENMPLTWEAQPYRAPASWWADARRGHTVDGHIDHSAPVITRIKDLMKYVPWNPREHIALVARRCYEQFNRLPPSWAASQDKIVERDFYMGYTTPTRWDYAQPARVITGGALGAVVHPVLPRTITHREAARILGFPDDWRIKPLKNISQLGSTWGKGITVDCGRWIGSHIRNALDSTPGDYMGTYVGDREWFIDVTHAYKSSVQSTSLPSYTDESNQFNSRGALMTEPMVTDEVQNTESQDSDVENVESVESVESVENVESDTDADAAPRRGRGRPRPQEAIERDELVYAAVRDMNGPATRETLATATGLDGGLIYLSLYRLRKSNRVTRTHDNGQHVWVVVDANETAPEPA